MKLVRYGSPGSERAGMLDSQGGVRSLAPLIDDLDVQVLAPEALAIMKAVDPERLPLVEGAPRLGVPIADLRQIFAIGLNYAAHAEEAGLPVPARPMLFSKSIASLCGAFDPIMVPAHANRLDWEVELAVVIGSRARCLDERHSLSAVAGYCLAIDLSDRGWQLDEGGQHGKGKSYDNFTPLGPWLLTADELADPQSLQLQLSVDEQLQQNGNTSDMIFGVAAILAHVSQFQTLLPGDVILTGTPAGVALGKADPPYLRCGSRIRCKGSYLGEQVHDVQAEPVAG